MLSGLFDLISPKVLSDIILPSFINAKFNHLGVAVKDLPSSVAAFRDLLNYQVIRGPIDDPIQKVSACFMANSEAGHPVFELVSPSTEDSPISSYMKRGIGGYHACYEVKNLDSALKLAQEQGCIVIGEPVPAVAFDNRKICWLFTPMRLLIELLEE